MLSVPTIIYSVWYFGENVDKVVKIIKKVQFGIFGIILFIILLFMAKYYLRYRKAQNAIS